MAINTYGFVLLIVLNSIVNSFGIKYKMATDAIFPSKTQNSARCYGNYEKSKTQQHGRYPG